MELIAPRKQSAFARFFGRIDWLLLLCAVAISCAGLVTMNSFLASDNPFFGKQVIWLAISIVAALGASFVDWRFLRRTSVVSLIYGVIAFLLVLLFAVGVVAKGAQSRFELIFFNLQPSEFAKLALIILLAKYFSRRHIEIAHLRHIFVSGIYAFIFFVLLFLQPDFGSAMILAFIWLGMVLIAGIPLRHLLMLGLVGAIAFAGLWNYGFENYQKQRIMTFLNPLTDITGTGYNAYQSTIAVGSGELLGKGVGFGTQSRLKFLPEYQTDFIFAAFAEEWGFIGVLILFSLYGVVIWRLLLVALRGATNFETLFAAGVAVYFLAHIIIHVGMNIGLLPVTGTTTPFMSYGGSHLLVEFLAIGMVMGMRRYGRALHREDQEREMVGV